MAATDILTAAEARAAINLDVTDTSMDTDLAVFNSAVSVRLDALCGPIVARTVTSEKHSGGNSYIGLKKSPVLSVTTVTEYVNTTSTTLTAETNASKPTAGYIFDDYTGFIFRRTANTDTTFASGRNNIEVTYSAGRYATTATVAAHFKLAAQIMLAHVWRVERGGGNQTYGDVAIIGSSFAVPNRVLEILADELLPPAVA